MHIASLAVLMLSPLPSPPPEPEPVRCTIVSASQATQPALHPLRADAPAKAGSPVLIVDVADDGTAQAVSVEKSSRSRQHDRAALDVARRWRYHCTPGPSSPRLRLTVPMATPSCTLDETSQQRHPPLYPTNAQRHLPMQGRVVLGMRANVHGRTEVILATGSGHAELDKAALAAARHWCMACPSPPTPDEGWWEVPVEFVLE